jgi:hypothetical protein
VQHNHVIHLLTLGTISDERCDGLGLSYQWCWRHKTVRLSFVYQLACSGSKLIF